MTEKDVVIEQASHVQQLIPLIKDALGGGKSVVVIGAMYVNTISNDGKATSVVGIAKMADGNNSGRLAIPKNVREAAGMVDGSEWSIMLKGKDVILRRRSVL